MGLARIKPAPYNRGSTSFLMVSRRLLLCWKRRDGPGEVGWVRALEAILHGDNFGPIAVGNGMHLQIEDQGQVNKEVGGLEGADFFPDEGLEGILGQKSAELSRCQPIRNMRGRGNGCAISPQKQRLSTVATPKYAVATQRCAAQSMRTGRPSKKP
jgi:hypothetical protein